jgi:predicted negative regulator of RcsB-dependent stress response
MGRRITRKQLKQDEFVSTMDTVIHWMSDKWRPVLIGLGAVCFVILLWWLGTIWSRSRTHQASYQLYQALNAYQQELAGDQTATGPDSAEAILQETIDRFPTLDQADVARVYLARIHMSRNELERARDLLVYVVDRRRNNAVARVAALDLVQLRVATGQSAEVAQQLEAMVAGPNRGLPRDAALFQLGELYVHQNELERARQYFEKLVEEFPESSYVNRARQRIAELG